MAKITATIHFKDRERTTQKLLIQDIPCANDNNMLNFALVTKGKVYIVKSYNRDLIDHIDYVIEEVPDGN